MAYVIQEITSVSVWDAFVKEQSPQALFQSWKWGEVEKKLGHKVWRLTWPDAIAQVVKVNARRGTFLHIRHGPIGAIHKDDLVRLAREEKAWFIRVSPRLAPHEEKQYKKLGFVPAPIHAMDAEICWVLDLDKSEEELLAGMRKTTRYEIRRAQKLGVMVERSSDIKRFFDLYDKTSTRHNFVQHRGIREEIETLDVELYLASHQGETIAAAIIVYFGDEAIYHHGASVPNKVGASYVLQWEAIREAKNRGKKLYNFWGIAPEDKANHPWRGITLFKTGFGGRQMEFMHAQDYPVSPLYILPKTIEQIRKRLKGY